MESLSPCTAVIDFEPLFRSAPGLHLVITPDLRIVTASDAYLRATLTRLEDIAGKGIFEAFPDNPDDPSADGVRNLQASLNRVLASKAADTMAVQKYDIRKPEAEGGEFEERYWLPVNLPLLDARNEISCIIHTVQDVTEVVRLRQLGIEQQKLTDELKSEERFHKAFNANPDPITIATLADGRIIDVNESFLRITGFRREEIIGRTAVETKFWERPQDRAQLVEMLAKQGSVRDLELPFRTKSGQRRIGLDSAEMLEVAGQKCVLTIFRDVTEVKTLEKQLRQSQKMEAIGRLSGGIAHDFNNLLSVIIGYSESLREDVGQNESMERKCDQIRKAGERAASLTRQLLAFSRQQVLEPKVLDLNSIVLELDSMLRRVIGEDVDLTTVLGTGLGNVKVDQSQIEQVIVNLVVNARDAMPQGGKLTIQTADVELDEVYTRQHPPLAPGSYVFLAVADTGTGMDAETQTHIFEPFFTTKEPGKGTGLGLSIAYGVVAQSGGHISVYSEAGHGTTFKIYLPRSLGPATPKRANSSGKLFPRGTQTILLVEDEEALRELTRTSLQESGYTVLEAAHPAKALAVARQHKGPIHLLLTDVIMPGMTGTLLAEQLAAMRPGIAVVFMSGYTGHTHPQLIGSEANLLPKPFTREVLLRKLQEVLTVNSR